MHGGFILPQNVPANEFLNLEGEKFSTSRNWAVWLHEYIERWPDRQDELRYALTTIMPEFKDSEFTWKDFQDKNNNELVAILGNFVQRVFVLCHKYYEGKVPQPAHSSVEAGEQDTLLWAELSAAAGTRWPRRWIGSDSAMHGHRHACRAPRQPIPHRYRAVEAGKDGCRTRTRTVLYNGLRIVGALVWCWTPSCPSPQRQTAHHAGHWTLTWDDAFRADLLVPGARSVSRSTCSSRSMTLPLPPRWNGYTPTDRRRTCRIPVLLPSPSKPSITFDDFC